jgi:hypothetical protein
MSLRSYRAHMLRITRLAAICASAGLLVMALCAALAAASCEESCEKAPSVTTKAATAVDHDSAWLNGEVNPHDCDTDFQFEYKKSTSESWIKVGFGGSAGSGTFNQPVTDFLPFLQPETTYNVRLTATNEAGLKTTGLTSSFTTDPEPKKPVVSTEAATGVSSTSATLNGFVNPNAASATYSFQYGTKTAELNSSTPSVKIEGSQKVKAEVTGLAPETLYYFRISASNSNGTTTGGHLSFTTSALAWKIKTTPNPGTSDNYLYDVSCETSTSACTAVGKSVSSGVDSPMALRWNGTAWSEQAPAKKSGATHTRLLGVDCPSEVRCLAVGNHQSAEGPSLLSELWNEGKWSVQTTPLPAESTSSEFTAIGCNSTANCTAVGSATFGGVKKAIAERWTSPNWALSSIPFPEGAKSSQLDGVDCLWSNFCVAVGRFTNSGGAVKSLAMFWNGTSWAQQTPADPSGATQTTLLDVSCTPTPNVCTAVGSWKVFLGKERTLAYRFTGGSTWTLQTSPTPTEISSFQEVSCATETSCTAVGNWIPGEGEPTKTLAAEWNGSSWSTQGTPNPVGASFSSLFGVSCRSTSCMGAGWSSNGSGTDSTLSEFRE